MKLTRQVNEAASLFLNEDGGSGFGHYEKGAGVKMSSVHVGDLIAHGEKDRQTKNIMKVTKVDKEKGKIEAVFVDPKKPSEKRLPDDKIFTVWGDTLENGEYWKAILKKKSDNSLPLAKAAKKD